MKKILTISAIFFLAACGGGSKNGSSGLTEMKAELESLRKQKDDISAKITALEKQVIKADPSAAAAENAKLVAITPVKRQDFEHYIDLQGRIATENIYYVTPRGMGGQVKAIYVKQGDRVNKGKLLLKLDDAVIRQQMSSLRSQLNFAKDIYERQQNVWKEGIGTEVQVLNAKNNVEGLERQMAVLNEQLSMTSVFAQASGIAEVVSIRVGEQFTGNPAAGITIINPSNLKAVVEIPENYIAKIQKGMPVVIEVLDLNKTIKSNISLISELIGQNTRSFTAEAKIPSDPSLKPNEIVVVKILDHSSKDAIVAPIATIQSDEKGKFVFVEEMKDGKLIARKKPVTIGDLYDEMVEVRAGLNVDDKLITQGFQGLYDGQLIINK